VARLAVAVAAAAWGLGAAYALCAAGEPSAPTTQPIGIELTDEGLLDIHIRGVEIGTVLQALGVQGRRNIVAGDEVQGRISADLYGVTFEEALEAILSANGYAYEQRGKFIIVRSQEQLAKQLRPLQVRVFKLHYIRAADAAELIQPLLSADGTLAQSPEAETGIPTSSEEAGGDASALDDCLVVQDYPDHLEKIARVIAELDVRPRQVLVEATILRAALDETNELGIDFNILAGVDFEQLSSTSPGVQDLVTGELSGPQLNNTNMTIRTDLAGGVTPGGLTFGLIKDQVAVFIRALEQITDVTVLANPKILALNKQRGEIIIGRRDGYLTTTVTETAAVQTVDFLETGTQLVFRPFIGNDGYVRMEIHPKDSNGGLSSANLPFEETTEATSNILVKDGHTIVIGGLFRERTAATKAQVPLLGNVPVLGMLFSRSFDETVREEVIILLTVHIIKDTASEQLAHESMLQDVERIRVGARRGLFGLGREQLAQAYYAAAVEHLRRGKTGTALFEIRMALHCNPRSISAIKLKERIQRRRDWQEDGSRIRTFVLDLIKQELGETSSSFDRPAVGEPATTTQPVSTAPARCEQDAVAEARL